MAHWKISFNAATCEQTLLAKLSHLIVLQIQDWELETPTYNFHNFHNYSYMMVAIKPQ
jgi:hypothetical protein